ncbi:JAB domain-containing protein [Hyphomonas sp. NPDC076881]|uniref:JAB domain-containing protein n=1 Tax=Hyphomonas sp. NPDC076881 TaxID=3390569 RepID=UPI003D07974E
MIRRDDHDRSPWTAPNKRLHLHPRGAFYEQYQLVTAAIRVVHNHPSGDPKPSRADISITREIIDVLGPFDISVHDHLVVGTSGVVSFRTSGLI